MEEAMKVTNLTRVFKGAGGEFTALKNINLSIPAGKLTILKGRSGSGKTTLMNILGTLDEPTSGSVMLNGMELTTLSERKREILRRTEMGFVFQAVSLMPTMNAYQNVEFGLRMAGWRMKNKAACGRVFKDGGAWKAHEAYAGRRCQEENSSVWQIARAIAGHPKILFADEPTAELDSAMAAEVVELFREITRTEGVTILMTTHDMGLMDAGDMQIELLNGEVVCQK